MSIPEAKCDSPEEALEKFEVSVRAQEMYISEVQQHGESAINPDEVNKNYESAKAEMLWWIKYIP